MTTGGTTFDMSPSAAAYVSVNNAEIHAKRKPMLVTTTLNYSFSITFCSLLQVPSISDPQSLLDRVKQFMDKNKKDD